MVELAVFLGNPGKKYSKNRHNAGFLLADILPYSLSWHKKFKGLYAAIDSEAGGKIHFLKPETFMNLSGEPVAETASFFKIKPEAILIVHDELELPLGTVSLKFGGGLGGHNGLRSAKSCLGTADFWRIRIGIGRPDSRLPGEGGPPGSGEGIIGWVLSNFYEEEKLILDDVLSHTGKLLAETFINDPKELLKSWAKKKVVSAKEADII